MRRTMVVAIACLLLAGCTTSPTGSPTASSAKAPSVASAYAGTWAGKLKSGTPVRLILPANVEAGGPGTYFYNGQRQAPQTPRVMGNQLRLDNPGSSHIMLGPVSGDTLPYQWINGGDEARATLTRVK